MTGPWKAWKTSSRFSTLPTAPWKSRPEARLPHSHSSGEPRMEKWKTKTKFPTFPRAARDYNYYRCSSKIRTPKP